MSAAPQPAAGGAALGSAERLALDYQQTTDLLRTLADVRLKLLALVPTLSGTAVALLDHPGSAVQLLALGLLGFTATLGILLYDLRGSRDSAFATRRARQLEAALGLGGLYSDAPGRTPRLFGALAVDREQAVALVYSAALAGWSYLIAWGVLHATHVGSARSLGAAIGAGVGLALLAELVRIDREVGDQALEPAPAAGA